ncbi:MAG: threonine ammonia-lyase [Gammaproteobacteria bacterium]
MLPEITLADIEAARRRLDDLIVRTPLIKLAIDDAPAEIWLKLENLQPIGSFKLRGAGNAMALADTATLSAGVVTASAGNMAQGVAWHARRLGVPCTVIVPDTAPETKLAAIARLGARTVKVPRERWWEIVVSHDPGMPGLFVHPVGDAAVIAGNGTIGLELLEDLPDFDTVIVPYGGGGLSCGIAAAVKAKRPEVRVYACELEHCPAFAAALAAGEPVKIDYKPSFVDAMGSAGVLPEMWPLAKKLLDGSLQVDLDEVAAAIRLLLERQRVLAEGAGAAPVAAALAGRAGAGKIVCIVSGGNLDLKVLQRLLNGEALA